MQIGAQLYTLRDFCKTTEDFALTLRKVADIGYKTVQVSGTCAYDPAWLANELQKNDLKCVLTHIPGARISGEPEKVAADHDVFGCKYVGLGYHDFSTETETTGFTPFLKAYPAAAKVLKERGKYFMYHNHNHEFRKIGGRLVFERLAEEVPADIMGFTVDTYWVQVGGGDPAQWIEKLAGRIPCIHLKDYAYGAKMAPVGEGNINFDRVFEKAEAGGTEYMLVEQDDCYGEDPFDCMKRSYDYLVACGFH